MAGLEILSRIPLLRRLVRVPRPTPDDVRAFWAAAHERWDTSRVLKADDAGMRAIAELLGLLGIVDKQDFLRRFTTVVDGRIYAPFEPGEESPDWPLWTQIRICAHEHVHVRQDRDAGGLGFEWAYITSSAQRAHYEAEAYRCDMVLEWRYFRRMLNPAHLAGLLRHYGCSAGDVEVARKMLALSIPSIKAGAMTSDVCRWAVGWLDGRWRR